MKTSLTIALMLLQLFSSNLFADNRVIYGDDNRRDLYDPENDEMMTKIALSTAILTDRSSLVEDKSLFKVNSQSFGKNYDLCKDERFFEQPNPGWCSGFLAGPDLFVTAGHCIPDMRKCGTTAIIFGFGYDKADRTLATVPAANVFYCREIIAQKLEHGGPTADFAVIRLDRPVRGRRPLPIRREGTLATGSDITVIGHPAGLPTKISGGAKVRSNDTHKAYFVTNLDTFGGNSGSAVLNDVTGEVEGVLVRGHTDFERRGDCMASVQCADNACRGEDVTKSSAFAEHIPSR